MNRRQFLISSLVTAVWVALRPRVVRPAPSPTPSPVVSQQPGEGWGVPWAIPWVVGPAETPMPPKADVYAVYLPVASKETHGR